MFHKGSDCLLVVPAFGRIDDTICLNQNLIVNAVDLRRTMVVPYQQEDIPSVSKSSTNAIGLDYKSDGLYMDSNGNKKD